ncbi:hypothetical protein GCM10010344_30390 [Streptomyces bluensis]|nr:hypothetical protein GCM10010344_30390 [Streptomyces bluensis]
MHVGDVVEDGLGGGDQNGKGLAPHLGEGRGVLGAEVTHDHCHGVARYGASTGGCLRISGGYGGSLPGGYGTIGP